MEAGMKRLAFFALFSIHASFGFATSIANRGKMIHKIEKRSISRQILTDPGDCIQNCSVNSSLPRELERSANPVTISCYINQQRSDCYQRCPQSDAKTLMLDNMRPFGALCNVPPEVLEADSACIRNHSVNGFQKCDENCPSAPQELLSPAVIVDALLTHAVIAHFETDTATVERKLKELCSFGSCQWSCKKELVETACGRETAERIGISYNLPFETIPQLYMDLKVIEAVPEECKGHGSGSKQVQQE